MLVLVLLRVEMEEMGFARLEAATTRMRGLHCSLQACWSSIANPFSIFLIS
jgi:hypothetical protein